MEGEINDLEQKIRWLIAFEALSEAKEASEIDWRKIVSGEIYLHETSYERMIFKLVWFILGWEQNRNFNLHWSLQSQRHRRQQGDLINRVIEHD